MHVVCSDFPQRLTFVGMAWNSPGALRGWFTVLSFRTRKAFVAERREQMRQTLVEAHIPFPEFNALFVSAVEFVCGLLVVLGALTPLACAMLVCVMIMAIATTAIYNIKAAPLLIGFRNFYVFPRFFIW